jgi:hypothetical protein
VSVGNVDTTSTGVFALGLLPVKAAQPGSANGIKAAAGGTDGTTGTDQKASALLPQDSNSALTSLDTAGTEASLQDQIRAAREQLNDWVTCVSSTTPAGKAEIRSLSTQISAAQEQISHLPQATAAGATASVDVWA